MTDTNTATQMSDQFKSMISGDVTCKSSGDLMTNYIAGTSIDARFAIEAVQDANGDPILFSISSPENTGGDGNDVNQLYVTMRDEDEQTGWKQFNISPVSDKSVQVCGVSQEPSSGKYILAVAVDSDGNGESEVYITNAIPQDPSETDWSDFSSQWFDRPGTPNGATVTRLLIGENPYGTKVPIIVATTQEGSNAKHYFIQGDTTKSNFTYGTNSTEASWMDYVLPADADEILDIAIGMAYFSGDAGYMLGTYALYTAGSNLGLIFTSVYDDTGTTHSFELDVPDGTSLIQSIPDINNSNITTLFASGNGLYVYESTLQVEASSSTDTPKPVVQFTQISDDPIFSSVKELIVRQDSEHVSIWARNNDQNLYYVRGTQDSSARDWTQALLMRQNVARIAAIRNQTKKSNAVIYVGSDNTTISYLWQDPDTTLWKETDMPLPTNDTVQEFSCYTTTLRFTDGNGNPVIQQDVGINASEWTYATVNGYYKSLDNDTSNPVNVKTDSQGKVTIINKVTTASTPTFWASADFLNNQHVAHPASNVIAGFSNIKTGQDLLDATTQDGEQVITGDLRNDTVTLNSVASGIQEIMGTANQLPADGTPFTGSPSSDGQVWGMSFSDGTATYKTGGDASQLQSQLQGDDDSFHLGDNIKKGITWAGDALESMWNDIEGVAHFIVDTTKSVVNGVANIIVEIGGKVVSFVVSTISDVLSFVGWLFETLKIGLETLIKWIGFLFQWGDILTTHDVIRNMTNQTADYFSSILGNSKDLINDLFDDMIAKVETMPALQIPSEKDVNLMTANSELVGNATPEQINQYSQIKNNPGFDFASYQFEHSGVQNGEVPDNLLGGIDDKLKTFIEDLVATFKGIFDTFESVFVDIYNLAKNGELTLGNIVKVLSSDIIIGILNLVRDIIIDLIDVVDLVAEMVMDVLNWKLPIPFVSGFYSVITKGDDFTILDCISLIYAIPVTIGYKMLTGNAPFPDGNTYGLDTNNYTQIFPTYLFPKLHADDVQAFSDEVQANSQENQDSLTVNEVFEDGKIVYSAIGGGVSIFSQCLSCDINLVKAVLQGEVKFINTLDTVLSAIAWAGAFPLSEVEDGQSQDQKNIEHWEQGLDALVWTGEAVVLLLKAILAKTKRVNVKMKTTDEEFISGAEVCQGIWSLVMYTCSLYIEVHGEMDGWDWEKTGQTYVSAVGGIVAGLSAFGVQESEKEGQLEIEVVAIAGLGIASILEFISAEMAGVRLGYVLVDDAETVFHWR